MNRGELWTVAGGVYASRPRPALIIQDDRFRDTGSVTVLPLTTTDVPAQFLRIAVPASASTGLDRRSYLMIDKLTTVRRANVVTRLGRIPTDLLVDVERGLLVFLGMAD